MEGNNHLVGGDQLWFKRLLTRWFDYAGIIVCGIMTVLSLATGASYFLLTIPGFVVSIIGFFLLRREKIDLSGFLLVLVFTILLIERSISIRSTFNLCIAAVTLIVAGIVTSERFTVVLFLIDIGSLVVATILGVFTLTQPQDPETGLFYANTISVALPLLIVSFIVALTINRILLGSISKLQAQNELIRKTQARLMTQEKLASIQILAGGIAHDFNNLLTSILGNIDLLKMDLETQDATCDGETFEFLKSARDAVFQARDLTGQLLTFSKGGSPVKKSIPDLGALVRDTVLFSLRGSNSKPEFHIVEDLWSLMADPGQIRQVVQNLVINADQAMEGGGMVEIYVSNQDITPVKLNSQRNAEPTRYVRIDVGNTGPVIPPELQEKIFDPFYTTKPEGTGLGLPICYSIVKNHDGFIEVTSQPDKTIFSVFLPAATRVSIVPAPEESTLAEYSGRVLIMDDEESIRKILASMLSALGFQAATTTNGQEAVTKYKTEKAQGKAFDIVIMDLTIPGGMGGKEALERLLEIDPEIRAIVSSGYSESSKVENYRIWGFRAFLKKPYTVSELAQVLREVLELEQEEGSTRPESRSDKIH